MNRFDTDTALQPAGPGDWEGRLDRGWWVFRGPNGGYLAAILARAMTEAAKGVPGRAGPPGTVKGVAGRAGPPGTVPDRERGLRSLTVHYLRAPAEGDVRVTAGVERAGRSVSTVSARMTQGDDLVALGLGTFSTPWPGPAFADATMPDVAQPEDCRRDESRFVEPPPMFERFELRRALGPAPFSELGEVGDAVSGGWVRLTEPRPLDALLAVMLMDAWTPAIFGRFAEPVGVPTLDLTVHLRSTLPRPEANEEDWCLAWFRSRTAHEGFVEEDGELWSADGVLLAQSRQLAVMFSGR